MSQTLVIVESPAKAKTIKRYLGKNYSVTASMGHVRDLPKSQFGVDVDNDFAVKYINIRGKGPLIKELKKAAKKADRVLLASDPDREGEAIAWHLQYILGLDADSKCRVSFNEITKDAVKNAIKGYREINLRAMRLVKDGGFLATCSCSHFMTYELFTQTIGQAAKNVHKRLRQVEYRTQAPDHPILWSADESYYLKFYIFQVVDEK